MGACAARWGSRQPQRISHTSCGHHPRPECPAVQLPLNGLKLDVPHAASQGSCRAGMRLQLPGSSTNILELIQHGCQSYKLALPPRSPFSPPLPPHALSWVGLPSLPWTSACLSPHSSPRHLRPQHSMCFLRAGCHPDTHSGTPAERVRGGASPRHTAGSHARWPFLPIHLNFKRTFQVDLHPSKP